MQEVNFKSRFTPDRVDYLQSGEIFVFGNNLSGYHAGDAACAFVVYLLAHTRIK
jgi:hypothetical protein